MRLPKNLKVSLGHLGRLLLIIGLLLILPVIIGVYYTDWVVEGTSMYLGYLIPSGLAIIIGYSLRRKFELKELNLVQGLALTGISWIVISFFSSLPFVMISEMGVLNSFFEAVSGFTTTGITMLTDIGILPKSLIFWRAMIQWIGGLGIITFFLFIGMKGVSEHILFRGESHKITSSRPVPNIMKTIKYLWMIYGGFTAALILLLWLEGTTLFDATAHAFTTLSTGGFSPHNASIEFYRLNGYVNYKLIEYTITVFMILGGTNFVIHYRVLKGKIQALWNNLEMKLWWIILGGSTLLIIYEAGIFNTNIEPLFRNTIFQVASIATTTGYQTKYIGVFGSLAKQIFLILMVIGGCVSSTGGGIKVGRVGIMLKGIWNRVKRASRPREMLTPLIIDGERVEDSQLERVFTIFATWIFLLVIGGLITALLSTHDPLACFSGMFSALGNIGPSYLSVGEIVSLNPIIKIFYIFGMLVGRLEILPVFVLLNREVWES